MADLDGFDEQLPAQLAAGQARRPARRGGLPGRRHVRPRDPRDHRPPRGRDPDRHRADGGALRALDQLLPTGATADREAYDIAWVHDKDSPVDTINGFVEVYMDPRGVKGSWEALVFFVNAEKTGGIRKLAAEAQWFEDHMPWDAAFRKQDVRGITANAIEVIVETGDSGPITPIGINLPNDQAIREQYGSKSVSLSNVIEAYDKSTLGRVPPRVRVDRRRRRRAPRSGAAWPASSHRTCTRSSAMAPGKSPSTSRAARRSRSRNSTRPWRSRAPTSSRCTSCPTRKLVELGLSTAADQDEVVQAAYEGYARNALVQLRRVREGTQIEEDHMRNRQMIVRWLMANTKAVEVRRRDGKTYYVMTDAEGVPRRRRPPAGGGPADQVGRRLPGGQDAVRDLRHPFRPRAARRGGRAGRTLEPALLHGLRPATARAGDRSRRRHRGRQDLVPDGPESTDAGVSGRQ